MATRADVLRLKIDVDEKQAVRDVKKFANETERSNRKVATSNEKAATSFRAVRTSMLAVAAAATGLVAAIAVVDRLAKQMEKISGLTAAHETLGKRINANAKTFLPALGRATRHAVSDMELMRLTNNAIILGVAESEQQFVKLAEGATRLGRAVGLDATAAVESLVTGIGRQSRLMLDNLGIIVKVEEANKRYAASIGKVASELSDEEKKTAFATEAIRAMDAALVGLNDETVRLSDLWNQAKTNVSNALSTILTEMDKIPDDPRAIARIAMFMAISTGAVDPGTVATVLGSGPSVTLPKMALGQGRWPEGNIPWGYTGTGIAESDVAIAQSQAKIAAAEAEILRIVAEREGIEQRVAEWMKEQAEQAAQTAAEYLTLDQLATRIDETFGTLDVPDFLIGDVEAPRAAVQELGAEMDQFGMIAAQSAASLGGTLIDAATGADIAMGKMFANMMKNLAAAIVQAAILKSIMAGWGGGGGGGRGGGLGQLIPILPGGLFARGGIVGQDTAGPIMAQHGAMVRGGLPGIDSVPIIAQRGEAVLPTPLTNFLWDAARNSQRQPQSAAGTTQNASLAAPTNVYVTLNVGPGGYADGDSVRRFFEDHPEAVAAGIRQATRRGAM
jgi:TusA-related sulfurtransferase